jgi:hypothetical protein
MLTIKEWAEKQWRAPGVLNAKHGNVFTPSTHYPPVCVSPGREHKDYHDAAARKRRRQLAMYTPNLTNLRRAELTLTAETDRHGNPIWRR